MILQKATYRRISLSFLVLFASFLVTPTLLVTLVDREADILFVFALVEEESKESKEKNKVDKDEPYDKPVYPVFRWEDIKTQSTRYFSNNFLYNLYCPGEVAPPPELA